MTGDLRWMAVVAAMVGTVLGAESPVGADVPFLTREAEGRDCVTTAKIVSMNGLPGPADSTPEMEASGRGFVELSRTGDSLKIPVTAPANALVIRHCIPDAPAGGGISATLGVYVNGMPRQRLNLSSRANWLYGEAGKNGQSNDPAAGSAHVYWDETRFRLEGGIRKGDTLEFRKEAADEAAFYRIDLVDLEQVAPPGERPTGTVSVTDYGADGADNGDDTDALKKCVEAAKAGKQVVWIPAGTFYQREKILLDGVKVRGAGMWHTTLRALSKGKGFDGNLGFKLTGTGAGVADLLIEGTSTARPEEGDRPFTATFGKCVNWSVVNVWMSHVHVGFWISGAHDGLIRGCRVRQTYADGINLNRGSSRNKVEHNHVRGTGDDGIAILSEIERTPESSKGNILRHNTISAVWWGHNCDLAGGEGHVVEDNLLADNPLFGVFTINLPGAYPMYPLKDCVVRDNLILRGGGNFASQRRGAMWIFAGSTSISGVKIEGNRIVDSIFRGIHVTGKGTQELFFERNTIEGGGGDGILIGGGVKGKGTFTANTARGLKEGALPFRNQAGDGFGVTGSGNSWD